MRTHRLAVLASGLALALLVGLAFPSACLAEDAAHGGAHPEAGHEEQANVMSLDVTVAVATIVVFGVLLLILTKFAWKPILTGLRSREEGIRTQIQGAEKANSDARALLVQYQQKLDAAANDARSIVEEGKRDAEALAAKIHAEAKTAAGEERDRSLKEIEIARQGALKSIYDQVASVATEVAGKILQQKLDPTQHRKLVDDAVSQYERSRKAPGARA